MKDHLSAFIGNGSSIRQLVRRVEAEYREMPGLKLTARQAQRLWGIDASTCAAVLNLLTKRRFLKRTANGAYLREGRAT